MRNLTKSLENQQQQHQKQIGSKKKGNFQTEIEQI